MIDTEYNKECSTCTRTSWPYWEKYVFISSSVLLKGKPSTIRSVHFFSTHTAFDAGPVSTIPSAFLFSSVHITLVTLPHISVRQVFKKHHAVPPCDDINKFVVKNTFENCANLQTQQLWLRSCDWPRDSNNNNNNNNNKKIITSASVELTQTRHSHWT